MKSLQDYIDTFKTIANKLNLRGDSIEVLSQLLANASYISEIENIAYAQEASLERATLINSKIQHCVNDMYSVFRGACPRVVIKFKPLKYFTFEMFQNIVSGNGFNIYYLGYWKEGSSNEVASEITETGTKSLSRIKDFIYAPLSVPPALNGETYVIVGLLCKETIEKEWTLNVNNTYYVDCLEEGLSNDMWVKIEDSYYDVTRQFSDHILEGNIFDLTLPSFGSRLYVADIFRGDESITKNYEGSTVPPNTKINATYYKFSTISEYNTSDLKRISTRGTELKALGTTPRGDKPSEKDALNLGDELIPGVILVSEVDRDGLNTIHYKASRDRYVNSILRSNSDIGTILEEMFPDKVRNGGTSYKFFSDGGNDSITIYYVPTNINNPLTPNEQQEFLVSRSAYYITDKINIETGKMYTVVFNMDIEIYQNSNIDSEVSNILNGYGNKFGVSIKGSLTEIRALISKISNVRQILDMSYDILGDDGQLVATKDEDIDNSISYYQVEYVINSVMR